MTIARLSLDQFTVAAKDKPILFLRRKSFWRSSYYVVAVWRDGASMKLARFDRKDCAQYWLDVEGAHWLDTCCRPISLGKALTP
jgi:hypothetical protein